MVMTEVYKFKNHVKEKKICRWKSFIKRGKNSI